MTAPTEIATGERIGNQWWRSWHGAPTDMKWLVVADLVATTPANVVAIVWCLLDYASQNKDRGSISGIRLAPLAAFTRISLDDIRSIISALHDPDVGVLDEHDRFAHWEQRQPKREDNSTERVRTHRARVQEEKSAGELFDLLETQRNNPETQCNAEQQSVTTCNAPDIQNTEDLTSANALVSVPPTHASNEQQAMAGAIAEVCGKDLQLDAHAKQVGQIASKLRKAHYTPEQVRNFGAWWQTDAWRVERWPIPSVYQLLDKITQGANYQPRAPTNGNGHERPDPPAQQRLRALRRQAGDEVET